MKLSDIMIEVEKYLEIDETRLSQESLNTGSIYGKVLRLRTSESIALTLEKTKLKEVYIEKREYYSGKAHPDVYKEKPFNYRLNKSEVEQYVEADPDIQKGMKIIEMQNEKIKYLEDALKMIMQRNYQIKAAIDYQKLISGA